MRLIFIFLVMIKPLFKVYDTPVDLGLIFFCTFNVERPTLILNYHLTIAVDKIVKMIVKKTRRNAALQVKSFFKCRVPMLRNLSVFNT